jgi:putative transposase
MKPTQIPLQEGKYYHIYNRGNNSETLFYTEDNYKYFLNKYDKYLSEYIDTYVYCLLPNHFHLLISVKETKVISNEASNKKVQSLEHIISFQFRKFFTSYAMSINLQKNRKGSLFQKSFKRKEVANEAYFSNLILYIHANPQLHGIVDDFKSYRWSSYASILADKKTKSKKEAVLNWFEGIENFIACHHQKIELSNIKKLMIEY